MTTITTMSLERRVELRALYGRDARRMFREERLNTHDIGLVLGVPESEVVRKGLHRAPLPSFAIAPSDMPPPPTSTGGHAA